MSSARNRASSHSNDTDDDDALVRALDALHLKNKKLVKATVHDAPADPSIKIRSWKMDEYKYGVYPSPFPTLARGLFTRGVVEDPSEEPKNDVLDEEDDAESSNTGRRRKHVIVARGYDKFFNIGEVPWNSVRFFLLLTNPSTLTNTSLISSGLRSRNTPPDHIG